MPNARRWCFTLNNPRQHNGRAIASLLREASCSFIIIGREYSDDGTPHLQGYCEFRRPSSLKDCKEINEYAHWEKAIASRSSNIEYCRKSDQDPYLFQDKKKGARTDLYAIYDKIKEGATVQEIMDLDFALWARNHRPYQWLFKRGFSRAMRAIARRMLSGFTAPRNGKNAVCI